MSGVRFEIRRTSDRDSKPCPEAVPGKVDYWDIRTFKSPEEHDAKLTNDRPWHARGTDHQVVHGPRGGVQGIKRKLGQQDTWFIEFDDLAALVAFFEKYGDLVITTSWADKETPMVEIYDGWRE
jgi:hypothetical protein